jgi:hypothetical protein
VDHLLFQAKSQSGKVAKFLLIRKFSLLLCGLAPLRENLSKIKTAPQ